MINVGIINKSLNNLPQYETSGASGLDLRASIKESIIIKPLERILVPTGIFLSIPEGYEAQIRPRSGLAYKHGITVLNTPGTIDSDYRGQIMAILVNLSNDEYEIKNGDRICQIVFTKVEQVSWSGVTEFIDETVRGTGGFGHTGKS